jgi:hypothetical protein
MPADLVLKVRAMHKASLENQAQVRAGGWWRPLA